MPESIQTMQPFEDTQWTTTMHEEEYNDKKVAYYVVSDWKIPFTYESWSKCAPSGPELIYEHCASKLTRPDSKALVGDSATRLYIEPGMVEPFEKMASFYFLRLLAGVDYKLVWKEWSNIRIPTSLLQDETFCLCVVALHPVLYGKLHPIGRNYRRVCLEAIALWNVKSFSLMQFAHPNSMQLFRGQHIDMYTVGRVLQAHVEGNYWVFNDPSVALKAVGKPGARKWSELEFCGPQVVNYITNERSKHGSSNSALEPYVKKNKYMHF